MTIALLGALVTVVFLNMLALDRLLKRHAAQIERLLQYQADPKLAALADMPAAELLYLPPEDDDAWHEHHRKADQ